MTLEEKINADLKSAMLAKDEAALRALRAVKSAILLAKTSPSAKYSGEEELKILQRLVKQRKESVDIYESQGRADLATSEKEEIAIIEKYLPAQLSENEIREEVKKIIAASGATSISEQGKVMGMASKALAGKADNKVVSAIVRELLSS